MNVTPVEVQQLQEQIASLSLKVDALSTSMRIIENLLNKQEGQNLAIRLYNTENDVQKMKVYQAERSWIPEAVSGQIEKIEEIKRFRYKALGVLIVAQVLLTGAGVAIFKYLYASVQ
jgi:DNA repair ATPase RecN